jgi:hypothetical protein
LALQVDGWSVRELLVHAIGLCVCLLVEGVHFFFFAVEFRRMGVDEHTGVAALACAGGKESTAEGSQFSVFGCRGHVFAQECAITKEFAV